MPDAGCWHKSTETALHIKSVRNHLNSFAHLSSGDSPQRLSPVDLQPCLQRGCVGIVAGLVQAWLLSGRILCSLGSLPPKTGRWTPELGLKHREGEPMWSQRKLCLPATIASQQAVPTCNCSVSWRAFSPATHQAATLSECLIVHLSICISVFMQWNCECLHPSALSRPSSSWMFAQQCTASAPRPQPALITGMVGSSWSEESPSFALPPQPTAHLCCTAIQGAVIPAGQERHCAYLC